MDDYLPPNQAWPRGGGVTDTGQSLGSRPNVYPGEARPNFNEDVPVSMRSDLNSLRNKQNGETISTPEGFSSLPVMASMIPKEMFLNTMNFDAAMRNPAMNMASLPLESKLQMSESTFDMLEQQQSLEQARLLQRFKELRAKQLQQQEILMQQQQMQLKSLRSEQQRAQTIIAGKQRPEREVHAGMNDPAFMFDGSVTPPVRKQLPGTKDAPHRLVPQPGYSQHMPAHVQHKGQLPCPVMYVPLEEETDEVKTNPDLFSDTNSHAGSQDIVDEGVCPISDRDTQDMGRMLNGQADPHGRSHLYKHSKSKESDPDEGFGTQSFRSSGQTDHQDDDDDDNNEGGDTGEFNDESEDLSLDDDEEEIEDEDQDTMKESYMNDDDRPIKPGLAGKMTFEQMLEAQMRAEEERLQAEKTEVKNNVKLPFLKRGEGISRFGMKTKKDQKSVPSKPVNRTSLLPPPKTSNAPQSQPSKTAAKQPQSKLVLKTSPKTNKNTAGKLTLKPPNQKQNKKVKEPEHSKKSDRKDEKKSFQGGQGLYSDISKEILVKGKDGETVEDKTTRIPVRAPFSSKPPSSIPDDTSFVEKLRDREKNSELEAEDLEEFEMLENFADNASFCSSSSVVKRILQKDQQRQTLPKVNQSPRQSVANQIMATARKDLAQTAAFNSLQTRQQNSIPEENHEENKDVETKSSIGVTDNKITEESESESEDSDSDESEEEEDSDEQSSSDDDSETEVMRPGNMISSAVQAGEPDLFNQHTNDSSDDEPADLISRSPSKIMTRKVASKEDRATLNTVSNLLQKLNPNAQPLVKNQGQDLLFNSSLNSSAFVPTAKSPIVISRDVVNSKSGARTLNPPLRNNEIVDDDTDDGDFEIHGKFSSPQMSSDVSSKDGDNSGNDSDTSYSALKISARKNVTLIPDNHKRLSNERQTKVETDDSEDEEENDSDSDKFDDNEEWGNTTLKAKSPGKGSQPTTGGRDTEEGENTPPTSKLMSKLFPKLKPQPSKQQKQQEQKLQAASSTAPGDGIQSKILREKLADLEKEIEKFRGENANLERLRKEREEGLSKLKKEILDFEKEKNTELQRIQEYKNEEMKKLKHEKKMFEKYQKAARNMPDKKEREEIETLKNQLLDLQEEMKRKETRWTNSTSRLRSKMEQLETENSELKDEIKLMEKKRLEWLQKEQNNKGKPKSNVPKGQEHGAARSQITQSSLDFQTTDSDEEKDPVRDQPKMGGVSQGPLNFTSAQPLPSLHPTRTQVNVRAPVPGVLHPPQPNSHQPNNFSKGQRPSAQKHKDIPWSSSGQSDQGAFLRTSLTEDCPRQDYRSKLSAFPQDTSICTDTEDTQYPHNNIPRKKADKFSIDRSVIDKGDSRHEEVQHPDGKVERVYKTGAREIIFSNGTRKEISADGLSIVVSFFNGDIKQIMPDQRIIYYYAEAQTTHSTYPDGLEILKFPNNQVEKHYPDKTKEIIFPDQTIKYLFQNGSEESIFPDGTVIRVDKNGDKTMEFPNGQREIHTQDYKRREYPDGTVKTVYPDGRQETRYSNGRIRVKDRDGNVIVDRRC